MGRRSPKLNDKSEAVLALLKYIKQQGGMTLLELEMKFTPREGGDNNGGRQWSRWLLGNTQPEIELVTKLYHFACYQLISGKWEENGNESQWAHLLPAVIDNGLYFLSDKSKRAILLEILKQLEHPLITKKMLRGITSGYYIPSADNILKIFWSNPPKKVDTENEYVPWHRIWSKNISEKEQMEILMTDIFMRIGTTTKSNTILKKFASEWGFKYEYSEDNLHSLANQLHHKIQQDARLLHEIRQRIYYIYPSEFKWTDDFDDEPAKVVKQNHHKLHECMAIADHKLQAYTEHQNSISMSSKIFGLFNKLSLIYPSDSSKWIYPAIEIM